MSDIENKVNQLIHEGEYCDDLVRLWQIVSELNDLGAWGAAKVYANKAERIKRELAEAVSR